MPIIMPKTIKHVTNVLFLYTLSTFLSSLKNKLITKNKIKYNKIKAAKDSITANP